MQRLWRRSQEEPNDGPLGKARLLIHKERRGALRGSLALAPLPLQRLRKPLHLNGIR